MTPEQIIELAKMCGAKETLTDERRFSFRPNELLQFAAELTKAAKAQDPERIRELENALRDFYNQACGMPKECGHDYHCNCSGEKVKAILAKSQDAERIRELEEVIAPLEFDNKGYCPVCCGWDGSKNGRGCTPKTHTKNCKLKEALAKSRQEG